MNDIVVARFAFIMENGAVQIGIISMNTSQSTQALNRQLARKLNGDARTNSQSPYAGKFVGIANGQVVAVCDSLDEVARLLRKAEPDPEKTLWIEASADYDAVDHV